MRRGSNKVVCLSRDGLIICCLVLYYLFLVLNAPYRYQLGATATATTLHGLADVHVPTHSHPATNCACIATPLSLSLSLSLVAIVESQQIHNMGAPPGVRALRSERIHPCVRSKQIANTTRAHVVASRSSAQRPPLPHRIQDHRLRRLRLVRLTPTCKRTPTA